MSTPASAPPDYDFTRPFWDGIAAGELRLPRCSACQAWQWYPLPGVEHCADGSLDWTPVGPHGSVFTFTVVRRPFLPDATKADVPLTTVLVELDDAAGVRLVGRLADGIDPSVGMRVTAVFDHDGDVDDVRFTPSSLQT